MADWQNSLDWTHIRAFLAVAEHGSLSAAARAVGQSQPTLGRHVKAAEAALGAELFTRVPGGLALTDAGRLVLEPAREMGRASARLGMLAAGQDARVTGTVRITASVVVSHFLLPGIIAELRREEPGIEVELVPSDSAANLTFREADIAVRMFRPTQLDVITRKVADQPLALYAARSLLEERGQPQGIEDLAAFPFVGFDRSDLIIREMRALGMVVDRNFFAVRCDDQAAFWQLVCAGCGIGAMQTAIGDQEPRVARLAVQPDLPRLPIWLVAPEPLYKSARVKRVWEALVVGLSG